VGVQILAGTDRAFCWLGCKYTTQARHSKIALREEANWYTFYDAARPD